MIYSDIIITYTPSNNEINRICGHTFEASDYYFFLKDLGYNVKVLVQDKIKKEFLLNAYKEKYKKEYFNLLIKDLHINELKKTICNTLIYTNGLYRIDFNNLFNPSNNIYFKKLISFRCNPNEKFNLFIDKLKDKFYLLYDKRVYKKYDIDNNIFDDYNNFENSFHYVKKFYFKAYKEYKQTDNKLLIYINSQLRDLSEEYLKSISEKYKKEFLFITGSKLNNEQFKKYSKYGIVLNAPVKNLFSKFDTYLYTRNIRNFDCSPRFLTECKYYNKDVILDFDISEDIGAYWRWYDIQNNFEDLILKENDLLLSYI